MNTLEFLLPGDLETATGGYAYDRQIARGLRNLGWDVRMHALDAGFPRPDPAALADADERLGALPENSLVLIDGLALGAMPQVARRHAQRLCLIALVHHPLCAETGLTPEECAAFQRSEVTALGAVRHIIVTSPETRDALAALGIAPARVSVVEPGTDAPPVQRESRTAGPVRLLCVATVTPRKGHAVLLDALAPRASLPWNLVCVGSLARDAANAARIRAQVAALGLEDRVSLRGELDPDDLQQEFSLADVFVLPTLHEGYGMVVAEALAHGVPVIATRTGAIPRLLAEGGGLLVPPGDAAALRAALDTVLTDPAQRGLLASEARRRGSQLPRWPDACTRFAKVLDRCLTEERPAGRDLLET